jgi:FtsP/CotA-like multicopper oxidase with cupredoxin domain
MRIFDERALNRQRRRLLASAAAVSALSVRDLGGLAFAAERDGAGSDVHIELRAVQDQVQIKPGRTTAVWRYLARLLRGEAGSLQPTAGGSLGPLIRVRRGQRIRIDLLNELPEPTIVHWHGLHVPDDMDGHPRHAIAPGQRYVYEFTVNNRAGTYWFHPHPHGKTGEQVYRGLAGLLLVSDDEERALDLPSGSHELSLVLQDRSFDDDNQLVYPARDAGRGMMGGGMMGPRRMRGGMGGMMARMMGVLGDEILVNGRSGTRIDVERRPYRLRLLNASNTRTYKLAWRDGTPLTVIATDGGLLAGPLQRDFVMLSAAERIELWVDFAHWPAGAQATLESRAFEGGVGTGGMMMSSGSSLRDGAAFPVLSMNVRDGATATSEPLPQGLSAVAPVDPGVASNADRPKVFELTMGMMTWGINGRAFDMLEASAEETVKLGTHELWEFRNEGRDAMMGMVMPHSMHVHGVQFRVIGREVSSRFARAYDTVKAGFVDDGWKDTVLVMPGERVRVLVGFKDYTGLFLYHCHMLEHEDSGLMRNYRVKA